MFPMAGSPGSTQAMAQPVPDVAALLRFPPEAVAWIRRAGFVIAVVVVILSWWANRAGWFEYRPGGTSFTVTIRPIFIGVFLLGSVIALRFEMVGGIICAFAAAALVAFAERQLVTSHAVVVVAAFALPALLWVLVDLNSYRPQTAYLGLAAAAAAVVAGFGIGQYVYEYFWGPTHPESAIESLPDSDVLWAWSGAVTETTARIMAKTVEDGDIRLVITDGPDLDAGRTLDPDSVDGTIAAFAVDGLDPDTDYRYAVEWNGTVDQTRQGGFRTFPAGPASFRMAVGACARVGSNGAVFDAIAAADPLLYVIAGDFHYGDIPEEDFERFREVLDLTLTMPAQSELYRSLPIAYVWDDHDYGFNDGDANSAGRVAAMASYRSHVPSYELAGPHTSIHQAFTVGRVRIIMTDARSERLPGVTMLGIRQKEWLLDELAASEDHGLVVWINPVPWIASEGEDTWAGYPDERAEIAQFIADNNIDNLVMVAGDAHMVAYDDGTNTNYSNEPGPAFPLIHTAALDRPGSVKGGPYSHEVRDGGGQFGLLDIVDDGEEITVTLEARDWRNDVIFSHRFSPGLAGDPSG